MMPRGPVNRLHEAAALGSIELTRSLLSTGSIDIDQGDPKGDTPLMCAALAGHSRIVSLLLKKGANPSAATDGGLHPLLVAAERGHLAVAKLLVKAGANLELATTLDGSTPLHMAVREERCLEVMRFLIDAGANPNSRDFDGATPIYVAALKGNIGATKMLLRTEADPQLPTTIHYSWQRLFPVPLDVAAQNGHLEVVRELIGKCGIEGCGGATGGVGALQLAARHGHVDIMAMLTDAGVLDTDSSLALKTAACRGQEASVKFLLQQQQLGKTIDKRAYVNSGNEDGGTPLGHTLNFDPSCRPSPRIVRWLVDAGADTASVVGLTVDARASIAMQDTPLALTTIMIRQKKSVYGLDATEDQLRGLEGIRRLLLRVEAVHAVSWLWQSDAPPIIRAAEGASTTTMISAPLARTVPLLRQRARRRGVLLATIFRHSQKPS